MLVNYQYFTENFQGKGVSETDFPRLERQAEDLINNITRGVAIQRFADLDATAQADVMRAICYQVEYYGEYGTNVGFAEEEKGFTVGKVTVQAGAYAGVKTYISPMTLGLLERHGLLCRSVGVRC